MQVKQSLLYKSQPKNKESEPGIPHRLPPRIEDVLTLPLQYWNHSEFKQKTKRITMHHKSTLHTLEHICIIVECFLLKELSKGLVFFLVGCCRWDDYNNLHMDNKNQQPTIYLYHYKSSTHTPKRPSSTQPLEPTLNEQAKKSIKHPSLAYLSTLMQLQNQNYQQAQTPQSSQRNKNYASPESMLITNQFDFVTRKGKKKDRVLKFLENRMTKVQSEERSIVNLIGSVRKEYSTKKQLKHLTETLNRNRTLTTIPIVTEQQGKKGANFLISSNFFKDIVKRKTKTEHRGKNLRQSRDKKFKMNRPTQYNLGFCFVKDDKPNTGCSISQEKMGLGRKRRGVTQPIQIMKNHIGRSGKQQGIKMKLIGSKGIFKLKTINNS